MTDSFAAASRIASCAVAMIDAFHLEEDASRFDHRNPTFRRPFAFPHTGFSRLLGDRLIGEDANPELAAALHVTRDRDTSGLDLLAR